MFIKLLFLESMKRTYLIDDVPPKNIYVLAKRVRCAKNGNFDLYHSGAVCYAWFVWDTQWKGKTTIERINNDRDNFYKDNQGKLL